MNVLLDILYMSEIIVSSNTAFSELYIGLASHWFPRKLISFLYIMRA